MPLPAPLLNLIYTNVPGSPTALYCVGKRMLSSYPHVPTGYELGVGVAVQSYNGKMCFGLTADAVAAADVKRLRDFIGISWEELCRAAGVRPAPVRCQTAEAGGASEAKARGRARAGRTAGCRAVPASSGPCEDSVSLCQTRLLHCIPISAGASPW